MRPRLVNPNYKRKSYRAWAAMKQRCLNPKCHKYPLYGGRGIRICDDWMAYENFIADMGDRPEGSSLDRINNDGDYEPENCRWTTAQEQQRNIRTNHKITYNGKTLFLSEWGELLGIRPNTILTRIRRGWTVERALGDTNGRD